MVSMSIGIKMEGVMKNIILNHLRISIFLMSCAAFAQELKPIQLLNPKWMAVDH
jgi:hypothetical protein